jgi:hypothetical protein
MTESLSPLTPALSPLKGEGVASGAGEAAAGITGHGHGATGQAAQDAAATVNVIKTFLASPFPLNGERAGVRGVKIPRCSFPPLLAIELFPNPLSLVVKPLLLHP